MPDMERLLNDLELRLTRSPTERAYVEGFHAGLSKARRQIAGIAAGFAVGVVIYQAAKHFL